MGHFVDGNSCDVQHSACDVTMFNYVSSLIADDDANICIRIVGAFLIILKSLSLSSMWNMYYNTI